MQQSSSLKIFTAIEEQLEFADGKKIELNKLSLNFSETIMNGNRH